MNEKLRTIIITAVIVIIILFTFTVGNNKKTETPSEYSNDSSVILANAEKESAAVTEEEKIEFPQIDVSTYLDYLEAEEARIILLARPTCHYCQIAEPILQKMAKEYNLDIYYLNTDNFNEETEALFVKSNEAFSEGFGTPFLFIVQNGSIVDAVDGLTDTLHYLEFFTNNGMITE